MSGRVSGSVRVLGSQSALELGLGREWRVQGRPRVNGWRGMLTVKAQLREPRELREGGGQQLGSHVTEVFIWSVISGW